MRALLTVGVLVAAIFTVPADQNTDVLTITDKNLPSVVDRSVRTFNVLSYQAVPDDGLDDTAAIQRAIDAAGRQATSIGERTTVNLPRGAFHVTTLLMTSRNVSLIGEGVLEQLPGTGFNQTLYIGANNVEVQGITIDGNYPAVTPGGVGHGISILADDVVLRNVTIRNVYDTGINQLITCRGLLIDDCNVISSGAYGMRLRGDYIVVRDGLVKDWNVRDSSSRRAIQVDSSSGDAESVIIQGTHIRQTQSLTQCDGILIDCGDVTTPIANGTFANDNGKNKITIDSGHGFQMGDSVWIIQAHAVTLTNGNSTITSSSNMAIATGSMVTFSTTGSLTGTGFSTGTGYYVRRLTATTFSLHTTWDDALSGASPITPTGTGTGTHTVTFNMSHRIRSVTGDVYVRALSSTTFTLHTSPAGARDNTGVVALSSNGSGLFYITVDGYRQAITGRSGNVLSVASTTGFITGLAARLTPSTTSDTLPAGLANAGSLTLTDDYVDAGSGATYPRPKKIKNVEISDIRMDFIAATTSDSFGIKVNNVDYLNIDRARIEQPAAATSVRTNSLRLGQGLRTVRVTKCRLSAGIVGNVIAWVPNLDVSDCEIGDTTLIPSYGFQNLQSSRCTFTNNIVRFSKVGITLGEQPQYWRDQDCDLLDVTGNVFECDASTRGWVMAVTHSGQLARTGFLRYGNNERRHARVGGAYPGLAFTVNTATSTVNVVIPNHALRSGDPFTLAGASLPTGFSANTTYYARVIDQDTITVHSTLVGAMDGVAATTNRVSFSTNGSGNMYLVSPKVGVGLSSILALVGETLTGSNGRDLMFFQRSGNGRDFTHVSQPTTTVIEFRPGDVVWKMLPGSGNAGWICTKPGVRGTTASSFTTFSDAAPF